MKARLLLVFLGGLGLTFACGFDDTLREYLDRHFWLPFARHGVDFERQNVVRVDTAFAGMGGTDGPASLARLRAAYQDHSRSAEGNGIQAALTAAMADASLQGRDREEVNLMDAKFDMWAGEPRELESPEPSQIPHLRAARKKLETFLRTAKTEEFLSEARGWLAHIHFVLGEQTEAGKIYLDELNQNGSNLSRETLLTSLKWNYGYDGGAQLVEHLDEYFDTPEHAIFAIELATNPHWDRMDFRFHKEEAEAAATTRAERYSRTKRALERHRNLFATPQRSGPLALLGMRTALTMGDPAEAISIAGMVPQNATVRKQPDFLWMLGSAHFVSRDYAGAERPLLDLFNSPLAAREQQAAAAYGLCGVYEKTKNRVEQIRFALWTVDFPTTTNYRGLYWAASGWDSNLLLDSEASIEELRAYVDRYPNDPDARIVKYALAVRLTREDQYDEAAQIYESIDAMVRGPRTRQLAGLYKEAQRTDLPAASLLSAQFELGKFIAENPNRIYFNDMLWNGLQNYALTAHTDGRLNATEHETLMADERKLRDQEDERWRAYLILNKVAHDAGQTELGRRAARLGVRCLRQMSARFGREKEIRAGDVELSRLAR